VEEEGWTAVTDTLRADLFMPPLSAAKNIGITAIENYIERIAARVQQRSTLAWIKTASLKPSAKKLESLARNPKPGPAALKMVTALYRADGLEVPESYRHAAQVLLNADASGLAAPEKASRYLLAHELAAVAAIRGDRSAAPVALQAMDLFLLADGQGQRYGTQAGKPLGTPAGVSVRIELGLSGSSKAAKG
jgi:hypothetical protein